MLVLRSTMNRFDINDNFSADCVVSENARAGDLYHVSRNSSGGANFTPIAYFFVWRPEFTEGFNRFWRVDCFVRQHKLSPDPIELGEWLVDALVKNELCAEPIWMSAHRSQELGGKAYGDIYDE